MNQCDALMVKERDTERERDKERDRERDRERQREGGSERVPELRACSRRVLVGVGFGHEYSRGGGGGVSSRCDSRWPHLDVAGAPEEGERREEAARHRTARSLFGAPPHV